MLLVGQRNVQPEGVFLRGALVAGLHKPRAAACYHHIALAGDQICKGAGLDVAGVSLLDAGRAETGNLSAVLVREEHLVCAEHFLHGAVHDFKVVLTQGTGSGIHDGGEHLQHRIGRMLPAETAGKVVQIRIEHRVTRVHRNGERGMGFCPAVDIVCG